MKTTLLRVLLVGTLAVGLLGATAIVGADTNETATDDDSWTMGQMADHMSDHLPGDHHDEDHAEHHAEHEGQHAEHHQESGHC